MIVKDTDLLIAMHEEAERCEYCDNKHQKLEVHHIFPRGMGGGGRLDIRCNLIVLCQPCHAEAGANKITKRELLGIAAEREIWRLKRA